MRHSTEALTALRKLPRSALFPPWLLREMLLPARASPPALASET